jgi:hypothetical protein
MKQKLAHPGAALVFSWDSVSLRVTIGKGMTSSRAVIRWRSVWLLKPLRRRFY